MEIAARLQGVQASASAEISQAVRALRAQGRDIIDLGIGQPDFDTPAHIIAAAHRAALDGQTRYPPTGGTLALKTAVAAKFLRDNALTYSPEEILISNGAKQIIFNGFMATLEPGDEVLLCAPFFDSYASIVRVLGGVPVKLEVREADGFILQPGDLAAAIGPRTRWLLLNSPGNPTGAVYGAGDYQALGAVLADHPQILIMSDEIYEHIIFDGAQHVSFAAACQELQDRTLTVNGASKAYAMTGWRIGYGGGPRSLMQAMMVVQSQICSGACSIAQAAAVAALDGPQDFVVAARAAYQARRDLVFAGVNAIPGLSLRKPGGAFYALVNVENLPFATDREVAQFFLNEAGVAGVPGHVYGLSPFFRLSLAAAQDKLDEGLRRMKQAVENL